MAIEAGQQLLHYRLIEKIGESGMGVVWKAADTALDRHQRDPQGRAVLDHRVEAAEEIDPLRLLIVVYPR